MVVCKMCGVYTENEEGMCYLCMIFPKKDEEYEEYEEYEDNKGEEGEDIEKYKQQKVGIFKGIYFYNAEYNYLNPETIWSFRQNIPELIVRDCIREFNLDDEQAEKLRIILLARGVNKWFYARREFLRLKHDVKDMLKSKELPYNDKEVHKIIQDIYVKMQNIAKMSRWIEWPRTVTHQWKNIEKDIEVKGRHS